MRHSLYGPAVRTPRSIDDVERVETSARSPRTHREAAAVLSAWAEHPHPDDEANPAELLSAAAWHLDQAGDTDAALELHRRAVTAEGTTTPDARCLLHAALIDACRLDEARHVADDLRRSGPTVLDCAGMAENFENVGDLQQAHRWAAIGVNRIQLADDTDVDVDDFDVVELLNVRRRVRQALGFPPDELDEVDL
jgi:hypothetical protein